MENIVNIDSVYVVSDKVVSREIAGELVLVPLVSGIGDMEDELFTLNETGRAIWSKLDGKKNLQIIAKEISMKYEASLQEIEEDVLGLVKELLKRRMPVEAHRDGI